MEWSGDLLYIRIVKKGAVFYPLFYVRIPILGKNTK